MPRGRYSPESCFHPIQANGELDVFCAMHPNQCHIRFVGLVQILCKLGSIYAMCGVNVLVIMFHSKK